MSTHGEAKKCIVLGCENRTDEGLFVKELLCVPCFEMLTRGDVSQNGHTFIHQMYKQLQELIYKNTGENE